MGGVCFSKLTLSLFSTSEQRTHWHAFAWHFVYLPQVNWHLVCLRQITSARTSTHPRRPRDLYRLGRGRQRDLCHRGRGRGTRYGLRTQRGASAATSATVDVASATTSDPARTGPVKAISVAILASAQTALVVVSAAVFPTLVGCTGP